MLHFVACCYCGWVIVLFLVTCIMLMTYNWSVPVIVFITLNVLYKFKLQFIFVNSDTFNIVKSKIILKCLFFLFEYTYCEQKTYKRHICMFSFNCLDSHGYGEQRPNNEHILYCLISWLQWLLSKKYNYLYSLLIVLIIMIIDENVFVGMTFNKIKRLQLCLQYLSTMSTLFRAYFELVYFIFMVSIFFCYSTDWIHVSYDFLSLF